MPLVSIVLPFFNGKEFVEETLVSIKNQTYKNFEVIVIDDGSTVKEHSEYLKELIKSLGDPRFKYHFKENGGLSNARNHGVALSAGEWIAFLDQDDLWNVHKLQRQVEVATSVPGINFIFTDGKFIGDVEGSMGVCSKNGLEEGVVRESYTRLLKGNFVICSSVMFKKAILDKVGDSNPAYKICPDYEYIIRFAERTDFYFINAELVSYRIHGANTVRNQLKQSAEVVSLLCDRKMVTKRQKGLATYNLARNILTIFVCWVKRIVVGAA